MPAKLANTRLREQRAHTHWLDRREPETDRTDERLRASGRETEKEADREQIHFMEFRIVQYSTLTQSPSLRANSRMQHI